MCFNRCVAASNIEYVTHSTALFQQTRIGFVSSFWEKKTLNLYPPVF